MELRELFGKINQGLSIAEAVMNGTGVTDPRIALAGFFNRRISTVEGYHRSLDYLIYPNYDDIPSLHHREIVTFRSGKNRLTGYLMKVKSPKGVVLCVHGYNSLSDNGNALFHEFFLKEGFDVFAIDLTSCGRSEGLGIAGLHQSALDVVSAENYLASRRDTKRLPLFLFGHSWGAYGCLASLNFNLKPVGVFAFSGFTNPYELMVGTAEGKVGPFAGIGRDDFIKALQERGGEYWNLSAIDGINNAPDTNIYLFHGSEDTTIKKGVNAVAGHRFKGHHVKTYLLKGRNHGNLFYTEESLKYNNAVRQLAKQTLEPYGGKLKNAPKDVIENFLASFDKMRCSVLDAKTFSYVSSGLEESLGVSTVK